MKVFTAISTALVALFLTACVNTPQFYINISENFDGLAVYYLDVGQGDAVLLRLPDNKVMLIDSGESGEAVSKDIKTAVKTVGDKIDYLVISHPDSDHVGNAKSVVDEFYVGTAYLPYLKNPSRFIEYYGFYRTIENKGVKVNFSDYTDYIEGEDYFIAFLSPVHYELTDSPYTDVNIADAPSSADINAVSPIIYLEYKGVRFVFTGDAPAKIEKSVVKNYEASLYDVFFGKDKVNLKQIDFLKVSHHGSNDASCEEFLSLLQPANAVISVGENYYGHPSTAALNRITKSNADVNVWRTDTDGTVSVFVDDDGYRIACALN